MATRSTIAMEQPDGRVMQVYCHWDGYLDNNGKILQEHYRDNAKVLALMLLGDISSLRKEIGQAHDFDARYDRTDEKNDWTTAYGRDRGETGNEAKVFKNFEDYKSEHQYEEYEYIYRVDGNWYVADHSQVYQRLEQAIVEAETLQD